MIGFNMNRGFAFASRVSWAVTLATAAVVLGGCNHEPFEYVKVKGKVTYEDGTLIPAKRLVVKFISQTPSQSPALTPRPGDAYPDPKTGIFESVTSHNPGDGIVAGEHKVLIFGGGSGVPEDYTRVETTPLKVNASDSPFELKIKKPSSDQ
jgi:hypothetical protein